MTESSGFPVTTAFQLPGMTVERDLGVAFGLVVRSMGFAKSFGASLTALRQGEVSQYTQLLEDSRRHAIDRMVENARLLGGNAVVAMRFDSSEIGQQLTEIVAYGTAVVARPA
ncbi:MAG TPA: YbjQ family protein [Streptosporangiaceae bacterium]